jgi:tetratricopeptide (TPR) repeat protein
LEVESRHDVPALDAYAWALYANGDYDRARQQIEKALAVGTRDAVLFYHAGAIEAAAGNESVAIRNFQQSLDTNPTSEVSEAARRGVSQSGKYTAVRYIQ